MQYGRNIYFSLDAQYTITSRKYYFYENFKIVGKYCKSQIALKIMYPMPLKNKISIIRQKNIVFENKL